MFDTKYDNIGKSFILIFGYRHFVLYGIFRFATYPNIYIWPI